MSIYSALKNNAVEDAEDKPTFLSLKPLYLSTPVNVVPTYTTNIVTFVPQFSAFNMMIFLIYIPIIVSDTEEEGGSSLLTDERRAIVKARNKGYFLPPQLTFIWMVKGDQEDNHLNNFSGCRGGGSLALIHTIMIC